ncbi:hypothetical protein D3C76_1535560 [compost metagenome]
MLGGAGPAFDPGRAEGAQVVTVSDALDLDHIGAEIGQGLRGQWPGDDAGQVEDPDPGQDAGAGGTCGGGFIRARHVSL